MKKIMKLVKSDYLNILKIFLPSILARCFKLKNRIIFNSSFNNNFNFNSKYLFEYFIDNPIENYEIKYVIKNDEKRKKLTEKYGNHFMTNQGLKNIMYILGSKLWIISTLESPVFSIYKDRRRKIFHLGHGIPLKKVIMAEEEISFLQKINRILRIRNFTHIASYSDFFLNIMKESFKLKNVNYIKLGQPRNDMLILKNKKEIIEEFKIESIDSRLILYAPTWRPYEKTKMFPFDNLSNEELEFFLEKHNMYIFTRTHPYYPVNFKIDISKNKRIIEANSDKIPEIMDYISMFDILITDYSSIYLDYIILNKPSLFFAYDLEKYSKEVGFSFDYKENLPGPLIKTKDEFFKNLLNLSSNNDEFVDKRKEVIKKINGKNYDNCKENYQFILEELLEIKHLRR